MSSDQHCLFIAQQVQRQTLHHLREKWNRIQNSVRFRKFVWFPLNRHCQCWWPWCYISNFCWSYERTGHGFCCCQVRRNFGNGMYVHDKSILGFTLSHSAYNFLAVANGTIWPSKASHKYSSLTFFCFQILILLLMVLLQVFFSKFGNKGEKLWIFYYIFSFSF